MKRLTLYTCACLLALAGCGGGGDSSPSRQDIARLGEKIFMDSSLSSPRGVACVSCHSPDAAFTDSNHVAVSKGAPPGSHGRRNAPTAMYAMFSPEFGFSEDEGDYVGGQFWDGRAKDLADQATKPFFGRQEMNLADATELRDRIMQAEYIDEFEGLFGAETLSSPDQTLTAVASAVAAFENANEFRPFSSKYDAWAKGRASLSEQEKRGLELFNAPNKGNCAACHPSVGDDNSTKNALFTDFTYDNVGLPKNPEANELPDTGLYETTARSSDIGRFKVSTLRNIEKTAPYFHNGFYSTLEEAVHFYNSRDVDPSIPDPEFPDNINRAELGNLGLTQDEESDIVAFLRTLTDGYQE